jgi:molybdenum-dependent oxidoreductase-like protein
VKWLYRLELSDRRPDGPFTTRYYNDPIEPDPAAPEIKTRPVWEIAPESVIVSPAKGDRLSLEDISIWGWAWADGGIRDVEVSTDGGNNWMKAELEERMGWAWQRFTLPWQPTAPGSYTLQSRATNSLGRVQPANNARNCVYEIEVHVVE